MQIPIDEIMTKVHMNMYTAKPLSELEKDFITFIYDEYDLLHEHNKELTQRFHGEDEAEKFYKKIYLPARLRYFEALYDGYSKVGYVEMKPGKFLIQGFSSRDNSLPHAVSTVFSNIKTNDAFIPTCDSFIQDFLVDNISSKELPVTTLTQHGEFFGYDPECLLKLKKKTFTKLTKEFTKALKEAALKSKTSPILLIAKPI